MSEKVFNIRVKYNSPNLPEKKFYGCKNHYCRENRFHIEVDDSERYIIPLFNVTEIKINKVEKPNDT